MRRQFHRLSGILISIGVGSLASFLIAGAGVANAATRFRSGARAHLLDSTRIATNGAASSSLHLTGPDVMASLVGLMAVTAFAFLVFTLIRRRIHAHGLTTSAA